MRNYILTEKERKILNAWLKEGKEEPGFQTLKTRSIKNFYTLSEDVREITKFIIINEKNLPPEYKEKVRIIKMWTLDYLHESAPEKIPDLNPIMQRMTQRSNLLVAALENSPEGVLILDGDFRVLYVNESFIKITGKHREEIEGITIYDLYNGVDYTRYKEHLFHNGDLENIGPIRVNASNGHTKWMDVDARSIKTDGDVVAYTVTVRDVTSKIEMYRELESLVKKMNES